MKKQKMNFLIFISFDATYSDFLLKHEKKKQRISYCIESIVMRIIEQIKKSNTV
jgi:hypothetical protein